MSNILTRRTVLLGAAVIPLAACAPAEPVPGEPRGTFGKHSTAEQVTEGLNLQGKTALITGSTSGIGYETMRVLALRGAHVLAFGRTKDKAAEACAGISGKTTPFGCEQTDLASVAAAADAVKALGVQIDMLICNAGIMALPELEQVNGIEKHLFVNHLSHFVLVNRLLEAVKAAPQGRVVVVGSRNYRNAPADGIEFDNLDGKRGYDPSKMYGQSKLANHLFTRELARRLADTPVTANTITPGVINTPLGRHLPWYTKASAKVIGWTFMKTPEEGAATSCYVATAPALAKTRGLFFMDCNPIVPGYQMENDALATKLWSVSEELAKDYLPKAGA